MTTALDIITLALKDAGVNGVGQTPKAEDTTDSFRKLNWMLAQWSRERWLVYHLVDKTISVSTGAASYSIGPGGNINVSERPDKIDSAYARQLNVGPNAVDYPLSIISAKEDYNRIRLKSLTSWPNFLFYDTAYPTGLLYFWPIPQAGLFSLTLSFKDRLTKFATLNEVLILPPEYEAAIELNLVCRLCPGYSKPIPPDILMQASAALATIRPANAQVPTMQLPGDIMYSRGGYNIYSDSAD